MQDLTFHGTEQVLRRSDIAFGDAQMRTLGLVAPDGFFANLGYLLSDQCEMGIKLARFQGRRKERFQTRREFAESLLAQAADALEALDLLNSVKGSSMAARQGATSATTRPRPCGRPCATPSCIATTAYRQPST